jgi:CRISPR/Cas system-associated exonuclease Cas4 (RecB family)
MKKPSVTELCDLLAKPALITWANKQGLAGIDIKGVRKTAKAAGTSMHSQIEDGAFDDPLHAGNYTRFASDKEIIATEKQIETEWFTGRYDVLLNYRGEKWLCDYKKSRRHRIWFEHKLQLVAYGMAEPVDRFAIIATPEFAFIPLEIDQEQRRKIEQIIVHLAQVWKLRKEIEA